MYKNLKIKRLKNLKISYELSNPAKPTLRDNLSNLLIFKFFNSFPND